MDGISVYRSRQNMGKMLAQRIRTELGEEAIRDIDVVIPIPETSNVSAAVVSETLGKPLCHAFVKNRYVFRTCESDLSRALVHPKHILISVFLQSHHAGSGSQDQERAEKAERDGVRVPGSLCFACRRQHSPWHDQSRDCQHGEGIRRAQGHLCQLCAAYHAPAYLVSFRPSGGWRWQWRARRQLLTVPSGIDLASPSELVAHERDRFDIAKHIGAEEVIYQDLDDLKAACAELSPRDPKTQDFEVGVFCGKYVTPVPEGYFEHLNDLRGKKRKIHALEGSASGRSGSLAGNSGPVLLSVSSAALEPVSPPATRQNGGAPSSTSGSPVLSRVPLASPMDRQDIRSVEAQRRADRPTKHLI